MHTDENARSDRSARRMRARFAGRACIALGAGAAVFQGLCAFGQMLTKGAPRIEVTPVVLPVIAGCALLLSARDRFAGRRSPGGEPAESGGGNVRQQADAPRPFAYSIVIPVYNRPQDVEALLAKLNDLAHRWAPLGRAEIIVVDDGSTDDTADVAKRCAQQSLIEMRVITQENGGSAVSRNTGFAHARGEIGVSIDSDCVPSDDWLPNLLRDVRVGEKLAAFGTVRSDRRARFPMEVSPAGAGFVTASFAIPLDVFAQLGGGFFAGFNGQVRDDTDFVLSCRRAGVATVTSRDALVWHPIRRFETMNAVWRMSLGHRFDVLLAERHGEAALPFISNVFLGGGWWGNFPTSCVVFGAVWVALTSLLSKAIGAPGISFRAQGLGWAGIALGVFSLGSLGVVYHRVPWRDVPKYLASTLTYVAGATAGRALGIKAYRLVLL